MSRSRLEQKLLEARQTLRKMQHRYDETLRLYGEEHERTISAQLSLWLAKNRIALIKQKLEGK